MKTNFIIPVMLMLATLACKKEEIVSKDFVVGEENNSKITTFNPRLSTSVDYDVEIDIDSDLTNDLKLRYIHQRYPGGGVNSGTSLELLNPKLSIAIDSTASIVMKDTSVFCIDTVEYSTCTDSLYFFRPTPKIFSFGDQLEVDQIWCNGPYLVLYRFDDSDYRRYPHPVIRESGIWNNIYEKYLVFRIELTDTTRMGWIKISTSEIHSTYIYEYNY